MKNLPQFRNKSHEEVRQYMLEKKGIGIGSNLNFTSIMIPILIVSAIAAGGYGLYWLIKQLEKRRGVKKDSIGYSPTRLIGMKKSQKNKNTHCFNCMN